MRDAPRVEIDSHRIACNMTNMEDPNDPIEVSSDEEMAAPVIIEESIPRPTRRRSQDFSVWYGRRKRAKVSARERRHLAYICELLCLVAPNFPGVNLNWTNFNVGNFAGIVMPPTMQLAQYYMHIRSLNQRS